MKRLLHAVMLIAANVYWIWANRNNSAFDWLISGAGYATGFLTYIAVTHRKTA